MRQRQLSQVRSAAQLPDQWIAVEQWAGSLATEIVQARARAASLALDLEELTRAANRGGLSAHDQGRADTLPQLIQEEELRAADLEYVETQVKEGLPRIRACAGQVASRSCLQQVAELQQTLEEDIAKIRSELDATLAYLSQEAARLGAASADAAADLRRLLCRAGTQINGNASACQP